jgi:hypothetical protein
MIAVACDVLGSASVIIRGTEVKNGAADAGGAATRSVRGVAARIAALLQKRARMHNLLLSGTATLPPRQRPVKRTGRRSCPFNVWRVPFADA